ncbi:MAG: metallophosphoesterase [Sphaerochaeta sp.]|nr:metallophosphoesterase [Sphaerochaeta sp.]
MAKRLLSYFSVALLVMTFVGCSSLSKQDTAASAGVQPLWVAGDTRDKIIVLSDLHTGFEDAYAEILQNRPYLIEFLQRISVTSDVREVVLNGDILDEWFLPLSFVEIDRGDFYRKNIENNKDLIAVFKEVMDAGINLVYVVGNHDMSVNIQYIEEAIPGMIVCSQNLGVGLYRTGDRNEILIEHGHRYDVFSAPDTITNAHLTNGPTMFPPGYFYARFAADWVLKGRPPYMADLPVIETVPDRVNDPDQFGAYAYYRTMATVFKNITPTDGIEDKLLDVRIDGYNDTYSIQDLYPVRNEQGEISAPVLFPNYQRTWEERQKANGVKVYSSFAAASLGALDGEYFESQARAQYEVDNAQSDTSVVLFGHTHVPMFYDYGNGHYYVNTGTWIDHNSNYKEKDGSLLSRTFAVVTTGPSSTAVDIYQYQEDGRLRDLKSQFLADHEK